MAELSLGTVVTLISVGVFTILFIILYCVCRSKNKLYDHTCVALLHPNDENKLDTTSNTKSNIKKETVVHISGYIRESAQTDKKLGGQNIGKEKGHFKEPGNKEKRGSTKLVKGESKRSSKKETRSSDSKDRNRNSRKEITPLNKNHEVKNEQTTEVKKKRSSKKELKPYEVKVELRDEQPVESSQVTLLNQASGQYPEKCPLDDGKTTLRESGRKSTRSTSQDIKPSTDTGNSHYLRPKSFEENTVTAKEKREKYSRSHSDTILRHSIDERDGGTNPALMRPRSLHAPDGRLTSEDYYVRPRSTGGGDWAETWTRGGQRSSSYYVTPQTFERAHRDSHYVRPRSYEDNEREKRRRSEVISDYYSSPRAQENKEKERDSYYVRPRSFEESERERERKESETRSSYVSQRGTDTKEERDTRESYYVKPRTLGKEERAKLDRESHYTRPRSLGDVKDFSNYVVPRSFEKYDTRDRESHYVHPRTQEKEHARNHEEHYVFPRSFDNVDSRESYYVYPRTLERDHESHYVIPRSRDQMDGRDFYYVHPRTLEEGRSRKDKDSINVMDSRVDTRYSSTQNVRPQPTSYRDKERRPRSADRVERLDRELKETQRSASAYYMTSRTLDVKERESRESRDRYRRDRNDSRDKSGNRRVKETSGEREKRESSRERKNEQTGTRREDRSDGRRKNEERYTTYGKDEGNEKNASDIKDRERSRERREKEGREEREGRNENKRYREDEQERRREGSRERERSDDKDKKRTGRNTERDRKEHWKDERERRTERYRRERSSDREANDERFKRRERSRERNEREKQEWKRGVERRSSRERERMERMKDREKDYHRSTSLKRSNPEDLQLRPRLRSRSLEYIPSSMERKKRQMHVIQRTKSWASRPSQRAESPPVPAQTIQLEFHPLSGDVTPLDSKSEVSTGPSSLNVIENVQLESSPVLDYEWPANIFHDQERKLSLPTDSRRSSGTSTSKVVNEGTKDLWYQQGPTSTTNHEDDRTSWYDLQSDSRRFYTTKNETTRTATPNSLNTDSRQSSVSYSTTNDYSPRLEKTDGNNDTLSGSLMFEYGADKQAMKLPGSADYFSSTLGTQDISTKQKAAQEVQTTQADILSRAKGIRTDNFTKPQGTQTEFSSKPQGTQTESLISKPDAESLSDLYYKIKDNFMDVRMSNSSYDSQSSTDDYRVYQNEVRKLNGRPRSTGSRKQKKEASTIPLLEQRVESERVINLKTKAEPKERRTPTSSISSEDIDWHLYTVDGRKVIKPDVTRYNDKGIERHSFTLSNKNSQKNVTGDHAVTQAATDSRNKQYVIGDSKQPYINGTMDGIDDDVFTLTPTVKRNNSRSKGSVRASLESCLKNPETTKLNNLRNTDLQRSSSQPVIFSFE